MKVVVYEIIKTRPNTSISYVLAGHNDHFDNTLRTYADVVTANITHSQDELTKNITYIWTDIEKFIEFRNIVLTDTNNPAILAYYCENDIVVSYNTSTREI